MNEQTKDFIAKTWFWILIASVFIINSFGVGIDIPVEYSLILITLSMIGFEISCFRYDASSGGDE